MTLAAFNALDKKQVQELLFSCCSSNKWTENMLNYFPFASEKDLIDKTAKIWFDECVEEDWRASFTHHPKIGDINSLKEKFASKEQASITTADEETIHQLAFLNNRYEKQFGFIFIVCATGKSASEMLQLIKDRVENSVDEELHIAMAEQQKITIIRLKKIISNGNFKFLNMSQITTHVLDTSIGKPGVDISIRLMNNVNGDWKTLAQGVTNADGRISDLLPSEKTIPAGNYKMVFNTGSYFEKKNIKTFYPSVEIMFTVTDESHYHVPLLINPFGYSTYRGS